MRQSLGPWTGCSQLRCAVDRVETGDGETQTFDAVAVALPNSAIPAISWGGNQLNRAVKRIGAAAAD